MVNGSRGHPVEIDVEQFGSLRASPDSVGAVIIDLHKAKPTRFVNLVEDDSDEDAEKIPTVTSDVEVKVCEPSRAPSSTVQEKVEVSKASPSPSPKGDGTGVDPKDLSEGAIPKGFTEAGKHLLGRQLPFEGPDVEPYDPFVRYVLKLYVARLMLELGGVTGDRAGDKGAGTSGRPLLDAEHFDFED